LGNHDLRRRHKAVKAGLRQARLPVLVNEGVTIKVGGGQFYLAGLDDGLWGRPNLKVALRNLPANTPVVLLVHEPDLVDRYAIDTRIVLQLSGHTHGGQIRLPGIGAMTLPELGRKYDRGLYRVNSTWLYTNPGLGFTRLPVRVNCLPEITELTLRSAPDD
jgi:predicted MPP superfamily phosphohydrolase